MEPGGRLSTEWTSLTQASDNRYVISQCKLREEGKVTTLSEVKVEI